MARKPPLGRNSFDDELYSFERWRSEQGLRSAGLNPRSSPDPSRTPRPGAPPLAESLEPPRPEESAPAPDTSTTELPDLKAIAEMERRLAEHEARLRREWEAFAERLTPAPASPPPPPPEEPRDVATIDEMERRLAEHEARLRREWETLIERLKPPPPPVVQASGASPAAAIERRLAQHEARLRREWETLRQLYEQPLQRLQQRYLPALEQYMRTMADHQRQLADAQTRIGSLEERVSGEFATTARHLREVATIIRDLTAIRDRAAEAVAPARDVPAVPAASGTRARRGTVGRVVFIAGIVLFAIGLAAAGAALYGRVNDVARRVTAAEQGLGAASTRVERIANVLAAPDVRTFALKAGQAAPRASGQALWSPTRGLVLAAAALPAPPVGQTYHAWLVTERGTSRLGPVTADRAGRVTAVFDPVATSAAVVGAQLTVGPSTGSASPSGPVALTP